MPDPCSVDSPASTVESDDVPRLYSLLPLLNRAQSKLAMLLCYAGLLSTTESVVQLRSKG